LIEFNRYYYSVSNGAQLSVYGLGQGPKDHFEACSWLQMGRRPTPNSVELFDAQRDLVLQSHCWWRHSRQDTTINSFKMNVPQASEQHHASASSFPSKVRQGQRASHPTYFLSSNNIHENPRKME
jgi:hypothetical protein